MGNIRQKGFSLLELLVVLVLLGFMAAITGPSLGRFLNSMETKKQTDKVLAAFRYARLKSVATGKPIEVRLSDDGKVVLLSGAVNEQRDFDLEFDDFLELEPAQITFYPEGQVTPGNIVVNKGDKIFRFSLDPLTGLTVPET